ncbi:hypothetical protein [Polymorphum gilvum]|uniref:Uncharacterized protein n=1 Tax=Polymorphum gilvum (strain LMG 25793 / CGMCC 1.9160 / SL003B-26A1) TaxID=991905 RepID=F2J200_POLGS|nr:hypothetical protein [Polymorphum gilvum]ADZ72061.1 hypothetical protein SL003B_3640 [Polymorphum gilvum SL003B-26A1]
MARWLSAVLAATWLAGFALPAGAETLTWHFRSEHPNVVSVELYSEQRNHVWPGGGKIYILDDYSVRDISISCRPGEKICYGAWVRNRTSSYWGVGYNKRNSCTSCCYTCNGGETKIIVLNP